MLDFVKENYNLFKEKIEEKIIYNKKYMCSGCGEEVVYNGATSHRNRCKNTFLDRDKSIKEAFSKKCVYCNESHPIQNESNLYLKNINYHKNFCSTRCYLDAKKVLTSFYNIKECVVCGKEFINKRVKTCSAECNSIQLSQNLSEIWKTTKINRGAAISQGRVNLKNSGYTFPEPWNKGLSGEEYLSHYEKDGKNTLYESLQQNKKFFKKTSIEVKIEELLKLKKIEYQYSWFCKNRQYDFFIKFKNCYIIIEADGDYWHKSKRVFTDPDERKIKRNEDLLKENSLALCKFKMPIFVIRFWEYDINNNFEYIEKIIEELQNGSIESIKQTVCKNKKYYSNWS